MINNVPVRNQTQLSFDGDEYRSSNSDSAVVTELPKLEGVDDDVIKSCKILVVDDEPVNIKIVQKHLRGAGYQNVIGTTESAAAMDLISTERPDLVLSDIVMPEVTGFDLLREIRSDDTYRWLPVIILTAHHDPETKCEALDLGATDFLAKPVDQHELVPRVRNLLTMKSHQDRVADHARQLEREIREQTQARLAAEYEGELRYIAGKAEVATDVLHNVGNALNSVNASANLVARGVRESRLPLLRQTADLLNRHREDLPTFLISDERGRVLPSYLLDLAETLLRESEQIDCEIKSLHQHLQLLNAVVATQQKYATLCDFSEHVALSDLLSDVEELLGNTFVRSEIHVSRDYEELPPVKTDKPKLLQVLLNVIKNAVESLNRTHRINRRLVIRIGQSDESAFIEVRDNGIGISRENIEKLFAHGFTTRKDGHGFGLHSCGHIMSELGGAISVRSDGEGCGATFTIELPFEKGAAS